ncbi:hypothetical protein [Helicobacter cappadocius]|uniref:Outer membrane protein n=1 Tax=Helicobacter cappadocius TaxID=3063998 RepID=A0AA90PJ60_9HELI|nr:MULTISPECIES: hypothetical protein [unclassified Helicobacter]MDO7252648.1 hypothetical protein [Helicobacter sp. faydin-H75]MDP2538515.1 hypothetical protein [Helicobacter sp. faydin-H76]
MKRVLYMSILLFLPLVNSFGNEMPNTKPLVNVNDTNTVVGDNITGGLFFGLSAGADFINNHFKTDQNLTSYNYSKDGEKAGNTPSFSGFNLEGKLGLIKTTKNIGIRIYGYYGRAWDSMETFGLQYTPINANSYYESAYLDSEYYGGMLDILFGGFQTGDITGYFSIGGGYQFTHYKLSGTVSLGYANTYFLDDDIYRSNLSGNEYIQSPVANIGGGVIVNKHHMFEINLRYLFINPIFINDSETKMIGTAGFPIYKKNIPDNTPITIRESIGYNFNLTFNYMYIF